MVYGFKRNSVNMSGAMFGIVVAIVLTVASPVYLVTLAAFFFSSSKATKYRQDVKRKIEKDFKIGGQRNWLQVLCNGGVGAFLALCHLTECGVGEKAIDFENHYVVSWLSMFQSLQDSWQLVKIVFALSGVAVMSAFACCNGDTWASELGILSKSDPILITSFKKVPRGTNGGVSSWGLFVSFLGGLLIGIFHYLATVLFVDAQSLQDSPFQFPLILLGGLAGLFGSVVDSYLGATLQFSGQTKDGFIVEDPNEAVRKISGTFKILNNHSVNLVSCIITAVVIPMFGPAFWSFFSQPTA